MAKFLNPILQKEFLTYKSPETQSPELDGFLFNNNLSLREVNPDDYNGNTHGVMTEYGNVMYFNYPLTKELICTIKDALFPIVSIQNYIHNQIVQKLRDGLIIRNRYKIYDLKNLALSEIRADWDNIYNKNIIVTFNGIVQIPEQHDEGVSYIEKRFYDAKASHSLDNIVLVEPIILH